LGLQVVDVSTSFSKKEERIYPGWYIVADDDDDD
jgi:hypothetical protein